MEFNSEKCLEYLKSDAASNLVNAAKNYSSRDERTLNRMITATVSALYGAADFHNISMLQKDDEKAAKKAGKSRFKQEMTRMAISAGTTFLTMGALDKYIKNSMPKSVMAIGIGAFLAEVGSRVLNKKPLHRLTPKEAEQIALKQHPELAESLKNSNKNLKSDTGVNFKQRLEDTNKIFVQFHSKDGKFPSMTCLDKDYVNVSQKNKKKKFAPLKIIIAAAGIASAGYAISSMLKGKYAYRNNIKEIYSANKEKIDKYLQNPDSVLDVEIINKLNEAKDKYKASKKTFDIFAKFKKLVTTKKVEIDANKFKDDIKLLQQTESGEKIKDILSDYISGTDKIIENNNGILIEGSKDRTLLKGVYEGFSKLANTIYMILSSPARAIEGLSNAIFYKNSNKAAEIIENRAAKLPDTEKISKVYNMLEKAKNGNKGIGGFFNSIIDKLGIHKNINSNTNPYEKAAQQMAKNARKFTTGPETSELANFSRTLVTAIATWFFVNDYTNSVLIESAGKDTQKAKEERNQRLIHKGTNFVFNGTLMNLFNSIFNRILNNSLPGATLIAGATEVTNEFLVRKSICQPVLPKKSKKEIIDYEEKQLSRKGIAGWWSRTFKKITGKKSLTQKTKVDDKKVK